MVAEVFRLTDKQTIRQKDLQVDIHILVRDTD